MDGSSPERREPSVAMQRIAIGRSRVFTLIGIVAAGAYTLLGVVLLLPSVKPMYAFQLVLGAIILATAIVGYAVARKSLSRFEREDGPDTGKQ